MASEAVLQYVWQHRLWSYGRMSTTDGRALRIIDPGLLNSGSGPDFFNAKVTIDGRIWVGNIEIHVRAGDWYRHGHHGDKAYDNVVLHVVAENDAEVRNARGEVIPQMVLQIAPQFTSRLEQLIGAGSSGRGVACACNLNEVPSLTVTDWVEALAFERLHSKVDRLHALLETYCGSWQDVCYVTMARTLGFGINSDPFERLARRTPLRLLAKHSDSLLQVEALLMGQAGLLDTTTTPRDGYHAQLMREYAFLRNKFSLTPMEPVAWKMMRTRPQNFPMRRIAMLAQMVHNGFDLMARVIDCGEDLDRQRALFTIELTGYWAKHYTLDDSEGTNGASGLSGRMIDVVVINTVAPLLFAYGDSTGNARLQDAAISLLEQLPAERNSIIDTFVRAGLPCDNALESQALIQLRRAYCDTRKCIYCRLGRRLLRQAATIKP